MTTFRKVRDLLLTSFDDGDISEDEFLLLYDVNRSKNPDFPHQNYEHFEDFISTFGNRLNRFTVKSDQIFLKQIKAVSVMFVYMCTCAILRLIQA